MKVWIRTAAALLAAALCVPAASCGKKDNAAYEYAYDSVDLEIRDEFKTDGRTQLVGWMDGTVYYTGYSADGDGYWHNHLIGVRDDGSGDFEVPIKLPERGKNIYQSVGQFALAGDGIWYVETVLDNNDLIDGISDKSDISYYLWKETYSGDIIEEIDITEILAENQVSVNYMAATDDGDLLFSGSNIIFRVSGGNIELVCKADSDWLNGLIKSRDGYIYTIVYDQNPGSRLLRLNLSDKKLEDIEPTGDDKFRNINSFSSGPDFDIYFFKHGEGIYGINIGETESVFICSLRESDLGNVNINKFHFLDDGRIAAMLQNNSNGKTDGIVILTKRSPDAAVKTTLTIGCIDGDSGIRNAVASFNKTNEKYRVDVIDYSENTDSSGAISQLNAETAAGRCPDMLLIDPRMPYDSYVSKGMLLDLYELDGVSQLLKSDNLFQNIVRGAEIGGKLYSAVSNAVIMSMEANKPRVISALGAVPDHIGAADLEKIISAYPDAAPFAENSRDEFAIFVSYFAYSQYVDIESGKCSFDSDEFIGLLDFVSSLPDKAPVQLNGAESVYDILSSGEALFRFSQIDGYRQYWEDRMLCFDGEMALLGFPGPAFAGTMPYMSSAEIAVCASSSCPEGCAEFITHLFGEQCQSETMGFPVLRSALEKKAEEAKSPGLIRMYQVNGENILLGPADDEAVSELNGIIERLDLFIRLDETASGIITEEVSAFLAGARSAEECASLIQNRVQNMLNERG